MDIFRTQRHNPVETAIRGKTREIPRNGAYLRGPKFRVARPVLGPVCTTCTGDPKSDFCVSSFKLPRVRVALNGPTEAKKKEDGVDLLVFHSTDMALLVALSTEVLNERLHAL